MSPSTIPSVQFSTREFEVWRESIAVIFDVDRPAEVAATGFGASVEAFQLGDMVVADAALGAQRYARSPTRVRRDGIDHFLFNLYRTGGWRSQTGRGEFKGKAGQVSVLDLSCELISEEPKSDLISLFVPRSLLEERLPNLGALHGSAPTGPHALLLAEYLALLAQRLPTLPAGSEQALSRATCEMLTACLEPSLAGVEFARHGLELVLKHRAKRFVEAQIGSSELNAHAICNAVGVSRRTLYRLFEPEGGVQRYIQNRRLKRVRSALMDPRDTRRISEVAAAFGFVRSDQLAKAFKHEFGHSATDARNSTTRTTEINSMTPSLRLDEGGFDNWIRSLQA